MISSRRRLNFPRLVTFRLVTLRGTASLVAILSLSCAAGCTSALTTTYIKGMPWDLVEHAAEVGDGKSDATTGDTAEDGTGTATDELAADLGADATPEGKASAAAREAAAAAARQAAVEEAVGRLASLGALDAETQATLVATLQRTSQEDWPTVVEEFSAALAESRLAESKLAESQPRIAAKPEAAAVPPAASSPASEPEPAAPEPVAEASPASPAVVPASLLIQNPCFASRVQAWGILDRFATPEFQRGQELIVYFELENLTASEAAEGHTTCIDTALSLVAADGRRLHAWTFEPIAETCPSRRRDYFARYVLRIPDEAAAGDCRVEVAVTDTLAGATATTSLPLTIVAD